MTLTVRDAASLTTATKTLEITVTEPDALPTAGGCGAAGLSWNNNTWTASCTDASTDDHGISKVRVTWGDGTISTGSAGSTFTHTYVNKGSYYITHKAYDTIGQSDSETAVKTAAYFYISGTVYKADGTTTVAGATVKAKKAGSSIVKTVYTTSTGYFLLSNLTPGTYNIDVTKPYFTFASPELTITVGGNSSENSISATTP